MLQCDLIKHNLAHSNSLRTSVDSIYELEVDISRFFENVPEWYANIPYEIAKSIARMRKYD